MIKILCEKHNFVNDTKIYRFLSDEEIDALESYRHIFIKKVRFFNKNKLEKVIEEAGEHERSLY